MDKREQLTIHPLFLILKEELEDLKFDKTLKQKELTALPVFLKVEQSDGKHIIKARKDSITYKELQAEFKKYYHTTFLKRNQTLYSKVKYDDGTEAMFLDFGKFQNEVDMIKKFGGIVSPNHKAFFICPITLIFMDKDKNLTKEQFIGFNERGIVFLHDVINSKPQHQKEYEYYDFMKKIEISPKFERVSPDSWEHAVNLWFQSIEEIKDEEITYYQTTEKISEKLF